MDELEMETPCRELELIGDRLRGTLVYFGNWLNQKDRRQILKGTSYTMALQRFNSDGDLQKYFETIRSKLE